MISVAMTTYKSKRYLEAQLFSIYKQTVLPDEIVICDDASQDDTCQEILRLKEFCPPSVQFRFFRNDKNIGYVENFEKAYLLCKGDVVFSCDADDVWMPEKIEKVMRVFNKYPETVYVFHDAVIIDADGNKISESLNAGWDVRENKKDKYGLMHLAIQRRGIPYGMSIAFRREVLGKALPVMGSHDEWFAKVLPLLGGVEALPDKLTCYRRHSSNTSGNTPSPLKRIRLWDRAHWFLHPKNMTEIYSAYLTRYEHLMTEDIIRDTKEYLQFQLQLDEIVQKRWGGILLLKLFFDGSYQKYRGTRNTLILDEAYLFFNMLQTAFSKVKKSNE